MTPPKKDEWGRLIGCLFCGVKLKKHPHAGQPRKYCSARHLSAYRRRRERELKLARCADCGGSTLVPCPTSCGARRSA